MRRRPMPRWVRPTCVVGLFAAALAVVHWKSGMSHDQAKALAQGVMEQVCARDCSRRGLRPQDLQGPQDTDMNHDPHSTKYECVWQAAGGQSLRVRVWDNGLTVQKGDKWNDMSSWDRP